MKVTNLCVFVAKIFLWDFFVLCSFMERTSLSSKIGRKVELVNIYGSLVILAYKNCLWEKMFFLIRHWKNYKETYYGNILVFKKQNYFENILCFFFFK